MIFVTSDPNYRIIAESWDEALVKLEVDVALGCVTEDVEIQGELYGEADDVKLYEDQE